MGWYVQVFKRGLDFGGRSRRREFWMFTLVNIVLSLVASGIDTAIGIGGFSAFTAPGTAAVMATPGIVSSILALVLLLPSLAVSIRRLHDTDRSGWWLLIMLVPLVGAVVLIVFWAMDSKPGSNRHGPNPKERESAMV
jgi:uncharacterized membrane protein YhaH (DUF805 family)